MGDLRYDTLLARREGLTRDLPEGGNEEDLRWVTNSSTLIFGDQDAVVVDTFATIEQNETLIEWVKGHDRRLTHIYLTHAHGDHTYGIGQLLAAIPGAHAVATAGTLAQARIEDQEARVDRWRRLFPGQIPQPVLPELLESNQITLEGHDLQIVEAGHTDTKGTTALWVPDIHLLVSGDVVYNNTHMFLAETTRESRIEWIAALRTLKFLQPAHVVAGHKDPVRDDDPSNIEESIQYVSDFNDAELGSTTAIELYETMLKLHPRRLNPGSLWGAAKLVKGAP
jgi:glyoxylase-like metal-dependent hydrolase (beta-lactamase superfamily II)